MTADAKVVEDAVNRLIEVAERAGFTTEITCGLKEDEAAETTTKVISVKLIGETVPDGYIRVSDE